MKTRDRVAAASFAARALMIILLAGSALTVAYSLMYAASLRSCVGRLEPPVRADAEAVLDRLADRGWNLEVARGGNDCDGWTVRAWHELYGPLHTRRDGDDNYSSLIGAACRAEVMAAVREQEETQ